MSPISGTRAAARLGSLSVIGIFRTGASVLAADATHAVVRFGNTPRTFVVGEESGRFNGIGETREERVQRKPGNRRPAARPGDPLQRSRIRRMHKAMAGRAGLAPEAVDGIPAHSACVGTLQHTVADGVDPLALLRAGRWKAPTRCNATPTSTGHRLRSPIPVRKSMRNRQFQTPQILRGEPVLCTLTVYNERKNAIVM